MGQEQGKGSRQPYQPPNNKQAKSCNLIDEHNQNEGGSPLKKSSKSSPTFSIADLQQQMGLDEHELIEIMEYLKKNKYYLDQTILGKGGNGYVLKGIDAYNYKVAIKVLKCETEEQYTQNTYEYENMRQCNSKYVVKVKDLLHYHNSKSSIQFLIMERCLTDLKQFMKDKIANNIWMSKKYIYETCLQLVLGLKAIHSRNVLHLDIKPANLLLGLDLKWKYTDLGVSKNVDEEKDHTVNLKGITACYSSPEQYQLYQFQSNKKITKQCDIYSLGVVFMELTGVDVRKKWVIKQKIRYKSFDKYLNPDFSELNDLVIKNMLQYNANSRITLEEIEILLKNLIASENKEKQQSNSQDTTTQEEITHKSVTFIVEESSPSKRVKTSHKKSFSVSDEKILELQPQQSFGGSQILNSNQIYQIQKSSGIQSPAKRIIIPIEKIQQYNYSLHPSSDSPENSPLKKRTTKVIARLNKGGSQTPISNSANQAAENLYMSGASLTPNKQRVISQHNGDQQYVQHQYQEAYSKPIQHPARRAISMHQNHYQEILPPIQNRIQQMNNNAYNNNSNNNNHNNNNSNNAPSPISFMKRSFIQQQSFPSQMISSQIVQNSSSQSPLNSNKKGGSKSFSQKIIIPKKIIPSNFNQAMMTKNQFNQQFLVSN